MMILTSTMNLIILMAGDPCGRSARERLTILDVLALALQSPPWVAW